LNDAPLAPSAAPLGSRATEPRRAAPLGRGAVLPLVVGVVLATSIGALGAARAAAAAEPAAEPWRAIETFRGNLERMSPFTAKFVQTYLPEGFSTGEQESGRMALHLPTCLRWDYGEPYPKSFILCGDVIHYWNPGESEGQVDEIEADREPGLDLLLVGVDELQRRYTATLERSSTAVTIMLRPTTLNDFVAEATLEISLDLAELRALRYRDPEGNRTEFRISDYQSGVTAGTFNYPKDIEWLDDY